MYEQVQVCHFSWWVKLLKHLLWIYTYPIGDSKAFKQGIWFYPSYNWRKLTSSPAGAPCQESCRKNESWIRSRECSPRTGARRKTGESAFLLRGVSLGGSPAFTPWVKHEGLPLEGVKIPCSESAWSSRKWLIKGFILLSQSIPKPSLISSEGGSGYKAWTSWIWIQYSRN